MKITIPDVTKCEFSILRCETGRKDCSVEIYDNGEIWIEFFDEQYNPAVDLTAAQLREIADAADKFAAIKKGGVT